MLSKFITLLLSLGVFILFIGAVLLSWVIIPIFFVLGICAVIFIIIYGTINSIRGKNKDDPT